MKKIDNDVIELIERLCGFDRTQQLVEMLDAGCRYAEMSTANPATLLKQNPEFWAWWLEDWQEVDMELVIMAMCVRSDLRANTAYLAQERNELHHNRRQPRRTVEINEMILTA